MGLYEDGAEAAMARGFENDPTLPKLIIDIQVRLKRRGYYEQGLVDAIGQNFRDGYTLTDAYAF